MQFTIEVKRRNQAEVLPGVLEHVGEMKLDRGEWALNVKQAPITVTEATALKRGLGVQAVNISRATKVKSLMLVGKNPLQIYLALKGCGRGYGLSSVKHDYAILNRFVKR
jgi:hypothetical protein